MSFASRFAGPSQADLWVFVEEQGLDPRPNVEPSPADLLGRNDASPRPVLDGRAGNAEQGRHLGRRHHVRGGERAADVRAHWLRVSQLRGWGHGG
jgi:hypothetical protein